jgi:hypothetical protein
MKTLDEARAREAKALSRWATGEGSHPKGKSGHVIVPTWESKNMWDTAPGRQAFSEWGNAAGME